MIPAVIKLIIDTRRTAPGAISLTSFITGWTDALTTFESFSIAVLIISRLRTSAQQNRMASHSLTFILKTIANMKTIDVIINQDKNEFSKTLRYYLYKCFYFLTITLMNKK